MDQPIGEFIIANLQADSIGSIIIRAFIWLVLVTIFAVGVGKGKDISRIKSEAGFFLLFIVLTAAAIYFAFGFIPTVTSIEQESYLVPAVSTLAALILRAPNQWQKIASYSL